MSSLSQNQLFLWEALALNSDTTVLAVFCGIALTLYCLCTQLLYLQLQEPDKQGQAKFTLGYISLVLFCTITYLTFTTRLSQLAFINNADFPGGPFIYEASYNTSAISYETAASVNDLILKVLTMAIQIWRLWIIWSRTQYAVTVTILPLLLLFSYIALDIPPNIVDALIPVEQLGISERSIIPMDTASYVVLSVFTVLVTGLVTGRILLLRRRYVKILGTSSVSSPYMSIVAMLIESYALESAWSVASAASTSLVSPASDLFDTADSAIKVIAYFLVVYRVATGRGWTAQTGGQLTTLQWNHGSQTVTGGVGIQSQMLTTVGVVDSPSTSHSKSVV